MLLLTYAPTVPVRPVIIGPELDTLYWRSLASKLDFHKIVASHMFGVPYRWVTEFQRYAAKNNNFHYLYSCTGVAGWKTGQIASFLGKPSTHQRRMVEHPVLIDMDYAALEQRFLRQYEDAILDGDTKKGFPTNVFMGLHGMKLYNLDRTPGFGATTSTSRLNLTPPNEPPAPVKKTSPLLRGLLQRLKD